MKTQAALAADTLHPEGSSRRSIRYAVVGLEGRALSPVLAAFQNAQRNSELVAVVAARPDEIGELGSASDGASKHATFRLGDFEACLAGDAAEAEGRVDAVYLALPNDLHREYAVRAANAGVHVLCERPLAPTPKDCLAMIAAADAANVRLMTGYPFRFQVAHRDIVEIVRSGQIGEPRAFEFIATLQVEEDDDVRLSVQHVGGPLHDLGIDCVHVARSILAANPTEVVALKASSDNPRFLEVDEMASWILRFPRARLAMFTCSYGAADVCSYRVVGTRGDLRVEGTHVGNGDVRYSLTMQGRTTNKSYSKSDAIAAQLLHFSQCIIEGREPETQGVDGFKTDVRVIEAVLHSAALGGQPIALPAVERIPRSAPRSATEDERGATTAHRDPKFGGAGMSGEVSSMRGARSADYSPRALASTLSKSTPTGPTPTGPTKPDVPTRPVERPPGRPIETPPSQPAPNLPGVPGTPPPPGAPTGPVAAHRATVCAPRAPSIF